MGTLLSFITKKDEEPTDPEVVDHFKEAEEYNRQLKIKAEQERLKHNQNVIRSYNLKKKK